MFFLQISSILQTVIHKECGFVCQVKSPVYGAAALVVCLNIAILLRSRPVSALGLVGFRFQVSGVRAGQ